MNWPDEDRAWMGRALQLAERGKGYVEPNPMVGAVVVRGSECVGEGWHQRFGGAHAEVEAIGKAGEAARGATLYVSLEPCCHQGKTPPCTQAILAAGLGRVVIAERDPFPLVNGDGIAQLRNAGVEVQVGLLEPQARRLNSPFHKLVTTHQPWVIAKWAMSLDGKIATRAADSQWISNEVSRKVVHRIRGQVDAIVVGIGTIFADDPLLTARPPGPRVATRVVLDSKGTLPSESKLIRTASEFPVLVVTGPGVAPENTERLQKAGCEVLSTQAADWEGQWPELLSELGRRRFTNVLVEGGAKVLGGIFEQHIVDEIHVFITPRIIGGVDAPSPVGGWGAARIDELSPLQDGQWECLDGDLHYWGRTARS